MLIVKIGPLDLSSRQPKQAPIHLSSFVEIAFVD